MKAVIAASLLRSTGVEMTPAMSKKETGTTGAFAALLARRQTETDSVETEAAQPPSLSENKTRKTDEQAELAWLPVIAMQAEGSFSAQSVAQGSHDQLPAAVDGESGNHASFVAADANGRNIRNPLLPFDHRETQLAGERVENTQVSTTQRLFQAAHSQSELTGAGLGNRWPDGNIREEGRKLNGKNASVESFFSLRVQPAEYEVRHGWHRENRFQPDGHTAFSANMASLLSVDASLDSQTSRTEADNGSSLINQVARALRLGRWMKLPNGATQLVIRLHPEHLGTVTVKMVHEGGKLAAKLLVSNDAVKELLHAHLPQLAQLLDASHITVEKWTVWTDFEGPAMPPHSEKRQGGRQHGESQQEQKQESSPSSPFALDGIEADA
ncbi:flagellar hook-length control protein FliK [Geobacillus subterraneus]|uniref:Flagellar hook-length control protein FliK n=2 Tax=Geobacillus TaxID=129337 RepID=A0ABN4NHD5_9BACL|nr:MULTISPECIES: flagellar hook-length control protein FliK [Geobacillus]AMX84037.1 flagellar hook-length control protein FliK [Geobacillus subterraneus]KZS26830.1 flagellar hook-length control protein FliK [Geobacillus subterraneus]OXB88245.1 flagellar hook-length control protein FliK [Geobacillus uzenensis]